MVPSSVVFYQKVVLTQQLSKWPQKALSVALVIYKVNQSLLQQSTEMAKQHETEGYKHATPRNLTRRLRLPLRQLQDFLPLCWERPKTREATAEV